jgi:hypothetical protein
VVFGAYEGKIDAKPGEKVVFIGDCAKWSGTIADRPVQIKSVYRDRGTLDPHRARHSDIFAKMVSVKRKVAKAKKDPYIRLEGCPVSVAEQVLAIVELGGTKNPYTNGEEVLTFNKAYLTWRLVSAFRWLLGKKYQVAGPCPRGHAMPEMEKHHHPHHHRASS